MSVMKLDQNYTNSVNKEVVRFNRFINFPFQKVFLAVRPPNYSTKRNVCNTSAVIATTTTEMSALSSQSSEPSLEQGVPSVTQAIMGTLSNDQEVRIPSSQ